MKKMLSILLASLLITASAIPAFAATTTEETMRADLDSVLAALEDQYPDAEVYLAENGEISVVVTESVNASKRASYYSPSGGSFRSFSPPIGYPFTSPIPYSKVFLPSDQTFALLNGVIEDGLIEDVVLWIADGVGLVITRVLAKYAITLSAAGVLFLVGLGTYQAIQWLDQAALVSVTNNYNRICITRTTTQGWPTNLYSGWVGNYCSDSPYSNFNPTFYSGVWDI